MMGMKAPVLRRDINAPSNHFEIGNMIHIMDALDMCVRCSGPLHAFPIRRGFPANLIGCCLWLLEVQGIILGPKRTFSPCCNCLTFLQS